MKTGLKIRNSTAEFLIFTSNNGENSIEVRFENENIWLTQKMMGVLFDVSIPNINEHLKNIFNSGELNENGTIRKFLIVQKEGNRDVSREIEHYNLETIIAIGFKINSSRAVEFRRWANRVLKEFSIKGFVLDKERLKNGNYLGEQYFEVLLLEIKEIRASERKFYQKITDIFATSLDYDSNSETTKKFFATVQNKLHFAIHGKTASEIITIRANHKKQNMGLTTWRNSPDGKIIKSDVSIAKNYLEKEELLALDRIVNMYLDYGEDQAARKIPMTMEDWESKLNAFLQFNEREILSGSGKITQAIAKAFAESEFEIYRVIQDKLYESDFDKLLKEI
ncbi:MAG: virulence RhuM family protein [Candidatus Gracilibacteria bacterium]|nr:virulence RhuM family protein [Candidatus Gracilibacteria bacterium]MDD2908654.1 virulence RhuM family protein [Candidatus Gracilibacteria bacterium]